MRYLPMAERSVLRSSSVSGSNRLVWLQTWKKAMGWCTTQWKMLLFCTKTIVKESRKFELGRLKKKEKKKKKTKKNNFGRLATFWFGTFAMLFSATGCVVRHENSRRWTVRLITAYKLAVLEILRNLYILRVHAIPTYRVYRLYDNKTNAIWRSWIHLFA